MSIEITDGKFKASGSFVTQNLLKAIPFGIEDPPKAKTDVIYSGDVIGHGIMYNKVTTTQTGPLPATDNSTKGLMSVSDNLNMITVYVRDRSSKNSYTLTRVD